MAIKSAKVFLIAVLFYSGAVYSQQIDSVNASTYNETINYIPTDYKSVNNGKNLFNDHCSYCHAITHEVVGPALANVNDKRPVKWLYRFISNSRVVINEDDQYANFLYNSYDQYPMPPFNFLSKGEIVDILAYIKQSSKMPGAGPASSSSLKTKSNPEEEYTINQKDIQGELSQESQTDKNASKRILKYIMIGVVIFTLIILAILAILFFKKLDPLKSRR